MGIFQKYTTITALIDVIIDQELISNWETLQTLCQHVNSIDDGPKQAAKALRKRFKDFDHPQNQMNAITVTQGLIDGCGSKFKAQMVTEKFIAALRDTLFSNATNIHVRLRLMERLHAWSVAFSRDPGLVAISKLYKNALKVPELAVYSPANPSTQAHPTTASSSSPEQRYIAILQDIELANNNAHMLVEAVSFADPEIEAVEENELIKEFHSKCITLHRGIQIYLNEMTNSATPNEKCLAALLSTNEELILALTAYNQMMERNRLSRAARISDTMNIALVQEHHIVDHLDGAGVGSGDATFSSSAQRGKNKNSNYNGASGDTLNIFEDDAYRIAESSDIAIAIKNGKRPAVSDEFELNTTSEQEQRLIQLVKDTSLLDSGINGSSSSSSSAAPATTVVAHPVVAPTV
ncbi:putative actin patch assembly and actin polymerization protein [Haplosporangium sp. Z 27]|nr:putative actin patch assembly and actin polymerization protein [Haplosporangium sp. Z 27]